MSNSLTRIYYTDPLTLPPAKYMTGETAWMLVQSTGQAYSVLSNGTVWIATSPAHIGTFATLPAPSSVVTGSYAYATDRQYAMYTNTGSVWIPEGLASGTAILDFGTGLGTQEASVVVTGQANITSASTPFAVIGPNASTSTHSVSDHRYFGLFASLAHWAIPSYMAMELRS